MLDKNSTIIATELYRSVLKCFRGRKGTSTKNCILPVSGILCKIPNCRDTMVCLFFHTLKRTATHVTLTYFYTVDANLSSRYVLKAFGLLEYVKPSQDCDGEWCIIKEVEHDVTKSPR